MRRFLFAALCLILAVSSSAQTSDADPATKDDILQFFQTMHSGDLIQKLMEVQSQSTEQLIRDQMAKDRKGPSEVDGRVREMMEELIKGMPVDEIMQAMVPAYQKHFTRGDIAAMNAFYSSTVGQKVLQELPVVTQEGTQAMMPILNKYLDHWRDQVEKEFDNSPGATQDKKPIKN
jgi:hypothetical protein